jgi:hypothetical protein
MVRVLLPLVCLAASCLPGGAWALGLGAVHAPPVLGQTLDLTLPITLADGETLDAGCIDAELHVGDVRVPADRLALALRPGGRPGEVLVRLRAGVAATQPVVTLSVTAGCSARVTRRYTLFAELPGLAAPVPASATTPAVPTAAGGGAPDAAQLAAAGDAAAWPAPNASHRGAPRRAQVTLAGAAAQPLARGAPMHPASPGPRSRPVDAEPRAVEHPAATFDVAASDAGPQPVTAEAALDRRPSPAERTMPQTTPPQAGMNDDVGAAAVLLLAALAAGGGVAGALTWWRRRGATAAQAPAATPPPATVASSAADLAPAVPVVVAPRPVPAPSAPVVERTAAVARPTPDVVAVDASPATLGAGGGALEAADAMPLLDLSLDEQIDLEQQVDFFVVLGRDDAAVDLLHEHLRRSGARMPLAWLKLLEIHRRGGDRGRYEDTARRFAEACGVEAPGWDAAAQPRHGLDDDAPRLEALQRRWSRPSDAMAWLDALLHHRHEPRGTVALATYEDALLLYRIARDLHDRGADDPDPVDLLLPDDVETSLESRRPRASPWRDDAPATREPGATLPFELDFDRVAATDEQAALVVR